MTTPDTTIRENLQRYELDPFDPDRDSHYCLLAVSGVETDDDELKQKLAELLEARVTKTYRGTTTYECNIGGCTVKVEKNFGGRKQTRIGGCKAASYCLKTAFEAVSQASDAETGRALYGEVLSTCEFGADDHSAGSFCPRLDCGLSAGVSVDGFPGTDGECVVELRQAPVT